VITHTVAAQDGRMLAVNEQGDPAGLPVFVHHGTPSSGLLYEPWTRDAAANGIQLIGFAERHLTLLERRVADVHEWLLANS